MVFMIASAFIITTIGVAVLAYTGLKARYTQINQQRQDRFDQLNR